MFQSTVPPTPEGTSLVGKTVIVTGGNGGLGLESARQFLTLGASRVILACRSVTKGDEAVSGLREDAQVKKANPDAVIEVFELDLDDYQSGMRFVEKVKKEVKELDILLHNGGQTLLEYQKSKSGHERMMQIFNYTPMLITLQLLPLLRATSSLRGSPSRITLVSSQMQKHHSLTKNPPSPSSSILDFFDDPTIFDKFSRYNDCKLVTSAYLRRVSQLAPPDEVVVNALCPGLVQTGLDKYLPFYLRYPMGFFRGVYGRTVEEGARTYVHAAVVAGGDTDGKFLVNNEVHAGAKFLDEPAGKDFTDRLWKDTIEDLAKLDPELRAYA